MLPQALLVGRPVISYDIDGAREVVLPETGILLKPRDLDGSAPGDLGLGRQTGTRGPRWARGAQPRSPNNFATKQ